MADEINSVETMENSHPETEGREREQGSERPSRDWEERGERGERGQRGRNRDGGSGKVFFKKKVCKFCTQKLKINYKETDTLRRFITERGKILPRRITGTCAKHQRELAAEIKKARILAMLPFVAD
jgi:small subunit ribosomal protein S18